MSPAATEAVNYIALAIPVFFLLIGLEVLLARRQQRQLYRLNDAGGFSFYVFAHFAAVTAATAGLLFLEGRFSALEKGLVGLFVVASVLNLGAVFERRPWKPAAETARLALAVAGTAQLAAGSDWQLPVTAAVGVAALLSGVWLLRRRREFSPPPAQPAVALPDDEG